MKCIFCGETIEDKSTWCKYCGVGQTMSNVQTTNSGDAVYIQPATAKKQSKKAKNIISVILIILSIPFVFFASLIHSVDSGVTGMVKIGYLIGYIFGDIAITLLVAFVIFLIRKKLANNKHDISFILSFGICILVISLFSFVGTVGIASNVSGKSILAKSADGSISMSVPAGWNTKDTALNASAAIAVSNRAYEQYVVIVKDPKSGFADNFTVNDYMAALQKIMTGKITNPVWGKISNVTIGGRSALTVELSGTADKINFAYSVYVVEGKNDYYQITGWTVKSMAEKNKPIIEKVVNSFHETA